MPRQVVLATHNAHKVAELTRILGPALGDVELVAYDGPEPVEDGETFEENALIKARAAHEHTGLPALADDSGVVVDALAGAPGIHSARYAGTRSDADNRRKLLDELAALPDEPDRAARFVCAAVYVDDAGIESETGTWEGAILPDERGEGGFGYDPLFLATGGDRSAAELTADEKDAVSHRSIAFRALAARLAGRLGG